MKRSPSKPLAPNVWSGVGGHVEADELTEPLETCYREIFEESGITRSHIFNLKLRYLLLRRRHDSIRESYIESVQKPSFFV